MALPPSMREKRNRGNPVVDEVVENAGSIAKMATIFALNQKIQAGNDEITRTALEMVRVNPNIDYASLAGLKLDQLPKELADVITRIDDICQKSGIKCDGFTVIKDLFDKLDSFRESLAKPHSEIVKNGSTLTILMKLKKEFDLVPEIIGKIEEMIAKLNSAKNDTLDDSESMDLISEINQVFKKIKPFLQTWREKIPEDIVSTLTNENIVGHLDAAARLANICNEYNGMMNPGKMETDLKDARDQVARMKKEFAADGKLDYIKSKLEFLSDIQSFRNNYISDSAYLQAFEKGFKEIGKALESMDNSFVKGTLLKLSDSDDLKTMMSPVIELYNKLKSTDESLEKAKEVIDAAQDIHETIDNMEKEQNEMEEMKPLEDCISKEVKCDGTDDAAEWEKEKKLVEENNIREIAQDFNNVPTALPEYEKMVTGLITASGKKGTNDLIKIINNSNDLVQEELKGFKKSLETFINLAKKWGDETKIDQLHPKLMRFFDESKFAPVLKCFQNTDLFTSIRKIIEKHTNNPDIIPLSKDNKNVKILENSENELKDIASKLMSLEDIPKELTATPDERLEKWPDVVQVSKDMAAYVKLLRDVIAVHLKHEKIEALLSSKTAIDNAISGIPDPKERQRMREIWNDETRKTLQNLPSVLEELLAKIDKIPKDLEGYKQIFNIPSLSNLNANIDLGDLLKTLQKNNATVLSNLPTEGMENVNLEFANSEQKLTDGQKAFSSIMGYFNSFSSMLEVKSSTESGHSTEILVGCGVGGFAIGMFIIFCTIVIHFFIHGSGKLLDRLSGACKQTFRTLKVWKSKPKEEVSEQPAGLEANVNGNNGADQVRETPIRKDELVDVDVFKIRNREEYIIRPKLNEVKPREETTRADMCVELNQNNGGTDQPETMDQLSKENVCELAKDDANFNANVKAAIKTRNQQDIENALHRNASKNTQIDRVFEFRDRSEEELGRMEGIVYRTVTPDPRRVPSPPIMFKRPTIKFASGFQRDMFPDESHRQRSQRSQRSRSSVRNQSPGRDEENARVAAKDEEILRAHNDDMSTAWDASSRAPDRNAAGQEGVVGVLGEITFRQEMMRHCTTSRNAYVNTYHRRDPLDFSKFKPNHCQKDYFGTNLKIGNQLNYRLMLRCLSKKSLVHHYGFDRSNPDFVFDVPLSLDTLKILIHEAKKKFAEEPAILELNYAEMQVIGDIHGKVDDFKRHVEVEFDNRQLTYLFTGDYVDRGNSNLLTIANFCILKILFPKRFAFLRGNHEQYSVNCLQFNSLYEECCVSYQEPAGRSLWEEINDMFLEMPIAAIVRNKIWVAHGGISPYMLNGREFLKNNLKKRPQTEIEWKILIDILWSDPSFEIAISGLKKYFASGKRSRDGHDFTPFGLEEVMRACRFEKIIRGHQVKPEGFEFCFSNKCLTIFGATDMSDDGNLASHIIIHEDMSVTIRLIQNYNAQDCIGDETTYDENLGGDSDALGSGRAPSSTNLKTAESGSNVDMSKGGSSKAPSKTTSPKVSTGSKNKSKNGASRSSGPSKKSNKKSTDRPLKKSNERSADRQSKKSNAKSNGPPSKKKTSKSTENKSQDKKKKDVKKASREDKDKSKKTI